MSNESLGEESIGWKLGISGWGRKREEEATRQRKDESGRLISHLLGQDKEPPAASLEDSGLASTHTLPGMGSSFTFMIAWFVVRL